jgi:two-component system sensor histidine kinase PilS (NtrC family)
MVGLAPLEQKEETLFDLGELLSFQTIAAGLLWLRLIFSVSGIFGVLLIQLHQGDFLNLPIWQPIYLVMLAVFASHIAFTELARNPERWRPILKTMYLMDAALIVLLMWILGSTNSMFLFLILTNCALAGVSLGVVFGLKCALWSLIALNLHFCFNPWFVPEVLRATWFVDNVSVFVVSTVAGVLGDQLQFVSRDIELKREEIKTLTNLNDLIVENITAGLLFLDSQLQIRKANRGAARIFEDIGLEGRPLRDVFANLEAEVLRFASSPTREAFERFEIDRYNFKGEKAIFEVVISGARSGAVNPNGFVLLIQNVTELKALQFALAQKEKLAAVGQLAAGIAHEIRNPLASMSGSIQLLQANLVTQTSDDKKLFAIVIKEIDRLNNLITEFLDFVRPGLRIEDPIQINSLLKDILSMVQLNPSLNRKVEQKTELRATQTLLGHYDKLKQAFLNVLINAYQATNDTLRPEIFVRTYDHEDTVVIEIQDNGCGISKDNLRRVFEPFHTTKVGGTGLGLAITHQIIQGHEAEVKIESEIGKGAKFVFVFKAAKRATT